MIIRRWTLGAGLLLMLALLGAGRKIETRRIQVRSAPVYARPSYLSPITRRLAWATPVGVVASNGSWRRIAAQGDSGWVQKTVLADKVETKPAAGTPGSTTGSEFSGEVLLAGKGFNEEVEGRDRHDHAEMERGYALLDSLARSMPEQEALVKFATAGRLLGARP